MRSFILKTFIITFAVFVLYKLTIGREIDTFSSNIKSLTNQHSRIEIKQKILSEIKKGSEKERIFSDEEREILSNFLKKIIAELDLKSSNQ